jgi:hypothetical protein
LNCPGDEIDDQSRSGVSKEIRRNQHARPCSWEAYHDRPSLCGSSLVPEKAHAQAIRVYLYITIRELAAFCTEFSVTIAAIASVSFLRRCAFLG